MAFGFYRQFTYDPSKVPSNQTNFPVLIAGTFAWAADVAHGGRSLAAFDIRPCTTTALSVQYTYQLHSYNAATGAFSMTVLVPTLSASVGNVIYMGIGDATLTSDGSSNTVWDANFKAVYNLGDGSTLSLADSTSNTNTLANNGAATAAAGPFAGMGAVSLNGTSQYLSRTSPVVSADPLTYECLFNPTNSSTVGQLLSQDRDVATTGNGQQLLKLNTGVVRVFENVGTAANSGNSYSASAWNFVVGTFTDTTNRAIRLNGGTKVSVAGATGATTVTNFLIGARSVAAVSNFYGGSIAQARVSSIVRADNWSEATRNNLILMPWTVGGEVVVGVKTPFALFQFTHR